MRHLLGLSGGKDSAALAVYMRERYPELPIEYFFTDTGEELPEVYEFLGRLEGYLGKPITYLNSGKTFDYWLKAFNHFLPSQQCRWCTQKMKIEPFKAWIRPSLDAGETVVNYVALRIDEPGRTGLISNTPNLRVELPFRVDGIDKAGVMNILKNAGLGLPKYYEWRSRSGCGFCFYQQKIEWVGLLEHHPEIFERAMKLEKTAIDGGTPFTWSQGESLAELSKPERVLAIKIDFQKRKQTEMSKRKKNPLRMGLEEELGIDAVYGCDEGKGSCAFCMK